MTIEIAMEGISFKDEDCLYYFIYSLFVFEIVYSLSVIYFVYSLLVYSLFENEII